MKQTLQTILFLGLLSIFVYGCWRAERYLHYKWSYQSMVQSEIDHRIQPLAERIKQLEIEVLTLKTNR